MSQPVVMIIDPDPVLRQQYQEHLGGHWDLQTAENAFLAIPQMVNQPPELVIVEARLPFVSGLQMCELVKDHNPRAAVIVMSRDVEALPLALNAGADALVAKPIAPSRLARIAEQLVPHATEGEIADSRRAFLPDPMRPCPHCGAGPTVRMIHGTDRRVLYSTCGTCLRVWPERAQSGRRRSDFVASSTIAG